MDKVSIIPTAETSYGIADRYDIKDLNEKSLHEDIKREDLKAIIKSHRYQVVYGEKYL